ncbi:hypothetical protein ACQEVY_25300 [Streptomyces sp. CA-288835]|uniref:hypothetical protein n=1 Tax=Streptomyces sp. CA-288835 TaxID=3240069 RepID=UPI003D948483
MSKQTYVKRDGWGNAEVRPIGDPKTHEGDSPESLVGQLVNVRPYYSVPDRRNGLTRARSPFVFEARVTDVFLPDMVKVRYTWETDSAPWQLDAIFYPRELHQVHYCECPACVGDGIQERNGA